MHLHLNAITVKAQEVYHAVLGVLPFISALFVTLSLKQNTTIIITWKHFQLLLFFWCILLSTQKSTKHNSFIIYVFLPSLQDCLYRPELAKQKVYADYVLITWGFGTFVLWNHSLQRLWKRDRSLLMVVWVITDSFSLCNQTMHTDTHCQHIICIAATI